MEKSDLNGNKKNGETGRKSPNRSSPLSVLKTTGGDERKMGNGNGERLSVEDIGRLVANSGFKVSEDEKKTAVDLLQRLSDFMTIEKKSGESGEATIRKLQAEGILTKEQAEKALKKLNGKKNGKGGIKYTEDQRKSINFSRTAVNHVIRLLNAL